MSKKRKKSRFTKTDVNTICEMQKKIDAYESYIMGLAGFSSPTKTTEKNYVILLHNTDMDDWVQQAWENIETMKYVCERVQKEELDKIKTRLSKNEDKTSDTNR